jgi:hypothetical protein
MMRRTIALFVCITLCWISTPSQSDEISGTGKSGMQEQVQRMLAGMYRGATVSITLELQDALRPAMQRFETETDESPHNDAIVAGIRIPYHTLKQMHQVMPELSGPSNGRTIEYSAWSGTAW